MLRAAAQFILGIWLFAAAAAAQEPARLALLIGNEAYSEKVATPTSCAEQAQARPASSIIPAIAFDGARHIRSGLKIMR